jgi:hypothetical protein
MLKHSKTQLEKLIRQRARTDAAGIVFTSHAKKRMRERNITMDMALDCLRNGVIQHEPETNAKYGTLECLMERYTAGYNIGLIVALSGDNPGLIVITAMRM